MNQNLRILFPGGFAAALACLIISMGCTGPGPSPETDTGVLPDTDSGVMPNDGGMPTDDTGVLPDVDAGTPVVDGGHVTVTCTPAEVASRTPGCGEQYDLPPDVMPYDDNGMFASCRATLGRRWGTATEPDCSMGMWQEADTGQIMVTTGCNYATDLPYDGQYRLGRDGKFYGNCGNRNLPGEAGNCGILAPSPDCTSMNGRFYHGGEPLPYREAYYAMHP